MRAGNDFNKVSQHPMYRAGVIVGKIMGNPAQAKGMFMNALKTGGQELGDMVQKIAHANVLLPVARALDAVAPKRPAPTAPQQ